MIINPVLTRMCETTGLGSSMECYEVMYFVTRLHRCKKILEIGTYRGGSAIAFAQAVLDSGMVPSVYSVDNSSQEEARTTARANLAEAGVASHVELLDGDSAEQIPLLIKKVGRMDLVLIDGWHSPDAVMTDYENVRDYTPLILFHDTGDGTKPYLDRVRSDGFDLCHFSTRYREGDGHIVGITLAYPC